MKKETPLVKFLLVDDLEENLLALDGLLRRDGLLLLKARSGTEALELLLEHDVALALLDVGMPGMNGFELAEFMRGTERTRRIPIIFLTAGATDQQRRFRGYEAGAVDFLIKPIENHVLQSKAQVFTELWLERQEVARQRDELGEAMSEKARLLEEMRVTADALKEADRRKDEFLATLAHELRNPLAPIGNGLQVMRMAAGDLSAISNAREMMERQHSHLVHLVDDLLDMSRVTTGKILLRREILGLRSVIETAVESSRPAIEAGKHVLTVSFPEHDISLNADATRLSQTIANLLTNAAKYTPENGQIELSVRLEGSDAVITVKDNGVGIPFDMLPKIFDLFTQVGSSLERSQGGLGIGLSLVKKLVELHDGVVVAESAGKGMGSTFTVRLPSGLEIVDSSAVQNAPSELSRESHRILIVDDNADGALSLSMLLGLDGHVTEIAYSGPEAVSAAQAFKPEIVFLDIGLPGMTGFEVAKILRSIDTTKTAVLIALTGWGSEEDRRRSKEAGFDYHLTKPIEDSVLENLFKQIELRK